VNGFALDFAVVAGHFGIILDLIKTEKENSENKEEIISNFTIQFLVFAVLSSARSSPSILTFRF
jgi:uncharacterized membrane protein